MLTLQLYEDSIDPECGHSSYLASDTDYDGHYRVGERECMACKAIEQWQDSQQKRKPTLRKGVKHYLWMKLFDPNGD